MSDGRPTPTIGIRAILRAGDSDEFAGSADIQLYETVNAALDAAVRQLRSAGPTGRRVAIDAGEVDLETSAPSAAVRARSAALLGAATSGQLLVSGTAASLVWELPVGLRLDDLGHHRFQGLTSPIAVFAGRGDGLAFGAIRTIDTVATSMPAAPTPLIGRSELLAELIATVGAERVVTLIGSGGAGKTRLAVDTALANAGRFDVVQWAELAPLGTRSALVDEVAALVGAHHPTSDGRHSVLLDELGRGHQLLVLDNAEHLIDATAAFVAEATERCPTLHVLVTSREALGVEGEAVRRVPPLTVAADDTPEAIAASDAIAFLIDRLRRAGFDAPLDDIAFGHLHRICTRLDGIPLALELAAARATTMPLADLAAGLDDRFELLSATRRTAQPRQRTLEASLRWSYDLLSEDERTTFGRLAVFSGSFEPADAVEVDGGAPGRVAELLVRLVERSLVTPTGDGRLRLLETVRAFAEDRLDESGQTISVRDRHLTWLQARTAEVAPIFDGPDPASAAATARQLMNDARAAIAHAERTRRADAIWGVLDDLTYSFFYDGHLDEALDWATRAAAVDDGSNPAASAPGLVAAALLSTSRGDHDEIVDAVRTARSAAEAASDQRSMGRALVLGAAHDSWHRPSDAAAALAEGRDLCAASGDLAWSGWGSCGAALALTFLGRPADALEHLDTAEQTATALRSRRLALDAAARRCICEHQLGRWGDARRTIERGRRLAEGFTAISVTACFDAVDAWFDIDAGHPGAAIAAMDAAIARYVFAGELQFVPLFVDARARAMIATGAPADAADDLRALRTHPGVEWASIYRNWLDHTLATALLAADDRAGARDVAERLVADAAELGNRLDAARGELLLARLDELAGEVRRGEARTADALDTLWRLGALPAVLDALEASSRWDEAGGREERARATARGIDLARAELIAGDVPEIADLVELVRRGRGDRGRPPFGWDSLTPTERRVAELVAEGLTNPQIAERLIVGRATVKTHVSNLLRKLDLTGRTQLATAHRQRAGEERS